MANKDPILWLNQNESEARTDDRGVELIRDYRDGGPAVVLRGTYDCAPELADVLRSLCAAATRIVEDDAMPSMVHMRELDRCRAVANQLLTDLYGVPLT